MLAANSLGTANFDSRDIAEIEKAVENTDLNNCRVLVYRVRYNSNPTLYEFKRSQLSGKAEHVELKQYDSTIKSTEARRYAEVFSDIKSLAPARDYGLILWSHGAGWAFELEPATSKAAIKSQNDPLPPHRYFGEDRGTVTQIDQLASAIPNGMFSFIYFDACYMGCVEVAYQLRNKARYMIGSTTLLPADGMDYSLNIPEFIKDTPDLKAACLNTYNYYNSLSGTDRTITIALYDLQHLDILAAVCHDICNANAIDYGSGDIQRYVIPSQNNCTFFDFKQYFDRQANNNSALLNRLQQAVDQCVVVKYSTPSIFSRLDIAPENYSGISSYIPGTGNITNENYYHTLDWYKAVYYVK